MPSKASWVTASACCGFVVLQIAGGCGEDNETLPPLHHGTGSTTGAGGGGGGGGGGAGGGASLTLCECMASIYNHKADACDSCTTAASFAADECKEENDACAADINCYDEGQEGSVAKCLMSCNGAPGCDLACVTPEGGDTEAQATAKKLFVAIATCQCSHCKNSCKPTADVDCKGEGGAGGAGGAGGQGGAGGLGGAGGAGGTGGGGGM